jgi:hypothetical protein
MSITKLFLFTKDTDASATEQGFHYQKLKMLKTWLENRVNEVDDVIFCDYEDDIFERNIEKGKSKFRQVKLYSTNFSFSKEEIQKSLAHFFMLFVKGDYMFDEVTFLFETNSGIAKETRGNDGDLLREWQQNQDAMSDDLVSRCRTRVKAIIDEYVAESYEQQMSAGTKAELQQAKTIYGQLTDEVWDKFIHAIKWQFDGIEQRDAIPNLLSEVETLISQLPLPIKSERASTYISILHYEIAQRTAQADEEKRILTNELMDILLLNEGSERDRWYAYVYQKWLPVITIKQFNIGAFYEVINAARHCRWELYETNHAALWLQLLKHYIELPETIIVCRRKAIYEYLFLLISPDPNTGVPKGAISSQQEWIRYYFNEFEHRNSLADIEEDITFLQIVQTHQMLNEGFLNEGEIQHWIQAIEKVITENIEHPRDVDDLCQSYELKGHFEFHINPTTPLQEKIESALQTYRLIIPLVKDAKIYSISRLSDQLSQILNMLIKVGIDNDKVSEPIEKFLSEIEEYAAKTGKQHNTAHNLVERGILYLKNPSSKNFLKALDCFHKAKNLWHLSETKDGFILALINIAQLYSALGMNLAAKYYGLCGVWASIHFGDQATFKRISDSYAMVFHADFEQGAWMSALDDFEQYIKARIEFKPDDLNMDDDSIFRNTLLDLACILAATPIIHPDLAVFIEYEKRTLGWLYTDHLQVLIDVLVTKFENIEMMRKIIVGKLTSAPLNDIGADRVITFNVLGIEWRVKIQNTAILNAIGEEFCALLQITLCEIGMLGTDLHLLQMPVTINICQAEDYTNWIKQQPSYEKSVWDAAIPSLDTKEQAKIQFHYGYIATNIKILLNDLSLLPKDEFDKIFDALYIQQKLGEKGLSINTYQKVYFNLLSVEGFNKAMRLGFVSLPESRANLRHPNFLPLFDGLSDKYNQEESLKRINERYQNTYKNLSVSISYWETKLEFQAAIHVLRKNGWLDWQILMALMNYTLNLKANTYMETVQISDEKERRKAFEAEFFRLQKLPESECYMEIPVSLLESQNFEFHIERIPVDTLHSFGLENNMKYPNFSALHSLLNKRFSFNVDDKPETNPLKNI